jgi:integrase
MFGYISQLFAAAVLDKVIGSSPAMGIRLPEIPHEDRLIATPEQVWALADALPEDLRAVVFLAAGCGLRPSECLGIELDNIDFLRREVHVRHQTAKPKGEPVDLAPLKTKTSRRTVELPRSSVTHCLSTSRRSARWT